MYLSVLRLKTSFTTAPPVVPGLGSPISAPVSNDFCQTNVLTTLSPRERRFVAFTCIELYHVSPSGSQNVFMAEPPGVPAANCGNGRRAWARVWLRGKP